MKSGSSSERLFRIKEKCRYEERVRDSRFLATAVPVDSEKEAGEFIAEIKKKFHDATHNSSAWRIGKGSDLTFKYSDDGEPSGSAGIPILKAIEKRDISDICVVVTRYFGGTKLGTGGLARAYGRITTELLKKCEVEKRFQMISLRFSVDFDFVGVVHHIIEKFKVGLKDSSYGDDVLFMVEARSTVFSEFKEKLIEATNGQVRFK